MAGYDMLGGVAAAMVEGMTMSQNPMNAAVINMMQDNAVVTKVKNEELKSDLITKIGKTAFSEDDDIPAEVKDAQKKIFENITKL